MTTRNTISQVQSNRNFKVQATTITGRKAVLVQIGWTSAKVIKTTVRRNFKISVLAMDTRNWTVIQRSMMSLREGQVIHYTQASQHPGYYYVTIVNESCTCVAGLYKQECHHQTDAVAFEAVRTMEAAAKISQVYQEKIAPIVAARLAATMPNEVTMPNGTRRMTSQVNDACLNSLDAINAAYAVADAKWQARQEQMIANLASVA